MSLWWLEPGWTSAICPQCGRNIWDSGGDPDWGLCYECFSARLDQQQYPEPDYPEPEYPEPEDVAGIEVKE